MDPDTSSIWCTAKIVGVSTDSSWGAGTCCGVERLPEPCTAAAGPGRSAMGLFGGKKVRAGAELELGTAESSAASGSSQLATVGSKKLTEHTADVGSQPGGASHAGVKSHAGGASQPQRPDSVLPKNVKYRSDPLTYVFEDGPFEGRMDIKRCGLVPVLPTSPILAIPFTGREHT